MTDIQFHEKTKEVISRFKNGERLYQESAVFNQVVQCLVIDMDIYDLFEQVIQNSEDITKYYKSISASHNDRKYRPSFPADR